ncbi:helix-turn-helix transcriptional regulator [Streptomyces sp. TRM 70351]|uniref:helix-turn-helix domain-containing protein n=1 Tax=Streptomyces sp. TRM 70351 TaxID=3116552 RepID=UPI002E7BF331|nr:helix-turn-helix transcriptional regulator [Streptomyces sp. TRM 70351]MEE1928721.1 helix-turn-helix transcriptional regulator [Streptomyces sp. TRM 70351]
MPNIKRLDPGASPLHYFGAELRRLREAAGLTLDQLGGIVFLTGSMIGQVETATKTPKSEHVPRLDTALGAQGDLVRLWEFVQRHRLPSWFQGIAILEAKATEIRVFQAQLVHGLLQTESYARAVLGVMSQSELDTKLEGRLDRQRILTRDDPPLLWVVLDEAVLHRAIGGRAVMRGQLAHLLSFAAHDHVQIQVLPFEAGAHTALPGSFTLFSFPDEADVAYSEGYEEGWATANTKEVANRSLRYDLLRTDALSTRKSAELIARLMEEHYGDEPAPGRSTVA